MWKKVIEDKDFDKILDEGRKSYADFFYKTSEDNDVPVADKQVMRKIINIRGESQCPTII